MKLLLVFSTLLLAVSALNISTLFNKLFNHWDEYKTEYHKVYNTPKENQLRFRNFLHTLLRIRKHNDDYDFGDATYKMGLNKFSDWFPEEMEQGGLKPRTLNSFSFARPGALELEEEEGLY